MPRKENGTIVETDREAMQAEKSPNTFVILAVSLAALAIAAVLLFWYFGVFENIGTRPQT
jgi:hypothetical protein